MKEKLQNIKLSNEMSQQLSILQECNWTVSDIYLFVSKRCISQICDGSATCPEAAPAQSLETPYTDLINLSKSAREVSEHTSHE